MYDVKDYRINSYRHEFELLSKVLNSTMTPLWLTLNAYMHILYIIIYKILWLCWIIKKSYNTIFIKNIQLYIAYFQVSLKTMATVFNKHGWIHFLREICIRTREKKLLSKICVVMLSIISTAWKKCDLKTIPNFEVKEKI